MKKEELLSIFNARPLITSRVKLCPMTEDDMNEYLDHVADSFSVKGTKLEKPFLENCKEQVFSEEDVTFSIRLKDSRVYIGYFEFKMSNSGREIGIELVGEYRKKGLGFEICHSFVDRIFKETDIEVIYYKCFRNNAASLHLAEKLGAVRTKERLLSEKIRSAGLSAETIENSAGFDLLIHEIRKRNWH